MRKLSIFIPSLMGGGAERVIVILTNEISQRGIAVDLVLSKSIGPYLADVHPSIRIVNLNAKRLILVLSLLLSICEKKNQRLCLRR